MSDEDLTLRDLIVSLQRSAAAMEKSAEAQLRLAEAVQANTLAVAALADETVTLATMLAPDQEDGQGDEPAPTHYMNGKPILPTLPTLHGAGQEPG